MNPTIKLQENGAVTVTDTETTTTLSKATVDEICRLVKDKDKQPIKPVITYGSWYQNKSNPKIVVFYEKDDAVFGGVGYGFDDYGGFTHANNWSLKSFKEDWQPATPETVEQYLTNEFIRLGFKNGVRIKTSFTWEIIGEPRFEFDVEKNKLLLWCDKIRCVETDSVYEVESNLTVFDNGKFATII